MQNFKKYVNTAINLENYLSNGMLEECHDMLTEKMITFGGKAYPKFGNIVIMAGGAGSGKGFIKDELVGLEGRTFDVDELKTLASKTYLIRKKVKEKFGVDLKNLTANLKDAENVRKLHVIIGDYLNLPDKQQRAMFTSIMSAPPDRKPNIIFDVTLQNIRKLEKIAYQVTNIGYEKKNIHIVWVVNDIEVAKEQNKKRTRTVPIEILINTHKGVSETIKDILQMGDNLSKYMDGDIVFAFNKINVDNEVVKSENGGTFIKHADYFYVKRAGSPPTPVKKIDKEIRSKISSYVPKSVQWND